MKAIVKGNGVTMSRVAAYLPANYHVVDTDDDQGGVIIEGEDRCGWTFDDYVEPRLASGLMFATALPERDPMTEPCPHDCQRFGGKVPGHLRGSNWDWVPCWCGGSGRVPRASDEAQS